MGRQVSQITALQRQAFKLFGARAAKSSNLSSLDESLRKARMTVRAELYLAYAWYCGLLAGLGTLLVGYLGAAALAVLYDATPLVWVAPPFAAVLAFALSYGALLAIPQSKARARGKDLDLKLPYATNYIAAMASAGVVPTEIFRSLAAQSVYGEASQEAAFIYKDLQVHGKDVVTALRRAIDRTPSEKFQELMQGAITTVTSGGDLTAYFREKSRRLQFEARQEQIQFTETMGLLAEAYVTAAVAGPLFLLVMIAIFVLLGSAPMLVLQAVVYLLLPVANLGFVFGLKAITPES